MKRIAAIIIAILLVFGFVSCSCGGEEPDVTTKTESGGEWSKVY